MFKNAHLAIVLLVLPLVGGCASSANLVTLNSGAEFQSQAIQSSQPAVVEFYLTLCPHCVTLEPKLAALADEYAGRARFMRIETGPAREAGLLQRYGITGFPTTIIFIGGQERAKIVGDKPTQRYRDELNRVLR